MSNAPAVFVTMILSFMLFSCNAFKCITQGHCSRINSALTPSSHNLSPGNNGDSPIGRRPKAARRTTSERRRRQREKVVTPIDRPTSHKSTPASLSKQEIAAKRTNDGSVFLVPEHARATGTPPVANHVVFFSLAELFPEAPGLADLFDEDTTFRESIRQAARDDLFVPDPRLSEESNKQLRAPSSSLEGNWQTNTDTCPSLTKVFASHAETMELSGRTFMRRLGGLCVRGGPPSPPQAQGSLEVEEVGEKFFVTGSWLDIVSPKGGRRHAAHAWHQDSGLEQYTAMLGFPSEDRYEGPGVFSHVIKLSHKMPEPEVAGPVIIEGNFPETHVMRPVYRKGCEVILYKDCDHIHSAPDEFIRDGLWRFM